ncbi:hypothetical protein [Actinospica robiniae]|uniref:hypothetical protein n=1 Tax=Actinospica robiniae TaxID=304901 RepID=UPI000404105E|nr:hypothetical protein [Actinospica robiniae]
MTDKALTGNNDNGEEERLRELLHAEAAAALDDDLDDEASTGAVDPAPDAGRRAATALRPRSQVYSIRVPVERLEQVRRLAAERGVAPTVMLREWVLNRLDLETGAAGGQEPPEADGPAAGSQDAASAEPEAAENSPAPVESRRAPAPSAGSGRVPNAVARAAERNDLEEMLLGLSRIAGRYPQQLGSLFGARAPWQDADALLVQRALLASGFAQPGTPPGHETDLLRPNAGAFGESMPGSAFRPAPNRYLQQGLSALQSTVAVVQSREHSGVELGSLYLAADDELWNP